MNSKIPKFTAITDGQFVRRGDINEERQRSEELAVLVSDKKDRRVICSCGRADPSSCFHRRCDFPGAGE